MKLKSLFAVAASLAFSILIAGCSGGGWTTFRGVDGGGRSSSVIGAPIGLKWKIPLGRHENARRFFNQPLVADDTIYFGSSDGNFYSMDIGTGLMNWTVRSGGPINAVAHVDRDNAYFGSSDGMIYCVRRATGETVWTYQTQSAVNSTIVPYRDMVVAASDFDSVYFIKTNGELAFTLPNSVWSLNSFCIHDGALAFTPGTPEDPTSLAVYDIDRREYRWALDTGPNRYPWFSFPAVRGNRLFYSSVGLDAEGLMRFRYDCIDFAGGNVLWERNVPSRFPMGSPYDPERLFVENTRLLDYGAPLLWRKSVIYASGDHALRSFDARNGKDLWVRDFDRPLSTAVTLAGDRLYFGLRADASMAGGVVPSGGALVCASPSTGRILWTIPVDGTILNSPVIAGRWILFGTDAGFFYVFEKLY